MLNKNYLIIYTFLISLLYFNFPFVEFFFLVPILIYLKKIKKINYFHLIILIFLTTLINFSYFYEFGYKYFLVIIFVNILIYLPFFIISKYLISKKYFILTIPASFFSLFYLLQFTIVSNFWINLVGFLKYFPISIQYIGSYGNIFLIILTNVLIYEIIISKKIKKISKLNYFILIVLILNFLVFNTYFFQKSYENNKELKIVGINGNLKQDWEIRYISSEKNFKFYNNLTNIAIKKYKPDIIIWPENTFTHLLEMDFELKKKLNDISKKNNLTLIVGGIKLENISSNKSKYYDTAFVFEKNNILNYRAYKPVNFFGDGVIGSDFNDKIIVKNTIIGIFLCYEENFLELFSKQINENNVEVFIVMGNLQYNNNYRAQELISKNSRLRAMENNRYLFRVENGGISQVIDNNGKILIKKKYNETNILFSKIKLINEKTIYSIYQKEIDFLIFLISIGFLIFFNRYELKKYF